MEKDTLMCNEAEVVKIVNTTMLPEILNIKHSIDALTKEIKYTTDDARKDRDSLKEEFRELQEELRLYKILLYGNGSDKPGLKGQVASISDWVDSRKKFESIVIGALIVQILGFLIIIGQHILTAQ